MYSNAKRINICRPGYSASCSLCCGSHNYRLSQDEIEDMFIERGHRGSATRPRHPEDSVLEKLFDDAIQCPNVGISDNCPGMIGCLIYDNPDNKGDIGTFFDGTCKTFLCPAWDCLTEEEVVFAARLTGDWYYYSLMINDTEALKDAFAQYGTPENVPREKILAIREELIQRLMDEDGK